MIPLLRIKSRARLLFHSSGMERSPTKKEKRGERRERKKRKKREEKGEKRKKNTTTMTMGSVSPQCTPTKVS